MTSLEDVMKMSEHELLRRGSVSKKLLVDALVATRLQTNDRYERDEQEISTMEVSTFERILDSKLTPFLTLISELKDKVDNLSSDFARLKQDYSELAKSRAADAESVCQEALQRFQRREFLIISGLQENSTGSLSERTEADTESVKSLAESIGLEGFKPTEVLRIGQINQARARLLRVKCPTVRDRAALLRGSKRLHNDPSFKNVYVNPDLTRQQRERNKELRREVKIRREIGEDVTIYRGEIVKKSTLESNFHRRF